jgi:hypothetical protein
VEDRTPPTVQELEAVKKIRIGNTIVVGLFVCFLPACLIWNCLFPGKIAAFGIIYVVVTGCISYPVSFAKCPRCGENFNMYHPFDWEHSLINDGGGSGGGNCIYCGFPFTRRERNQIHRLGKRLYRFITR